MQPAIRTQTPRRQRTDAQAFVVIDTSRSMAARPSPTGASRLQRAKQLALAIGPQLGDVPVGVATFTDRVLPDLFPTSDRATYDSTVSALGIEDPPPRGDLDRRDDVRRPAAGRHRRLLPRQRPEAGRRS